MTTALSEFLISGGTGGAATQNNLGVMYDHGRGVPQDEAEAVVWYRQVAEQGHAVAQFNFGRIYHYGKGVTQNYLKAHMWLSIAASKGDEDTRKIRDSLAEHMTSTGIAEVQTLAGECVRND